ncbi:sigma-70 family RNA polymerase sigma factor [Nakamurella sp. PAMC28650]|uniref:sigma-70 family RNA polymerase sigma factor n=1 Tax=Nakamurella sp. PAMC28650 TaxID=2762325 RepID=UPI00164DF05A|nr:sigma-70 family RNA polymerase sigma factor [Nakamurella sp. PAMC28650]QNK81514.1 sigma-70 family RNA polymerase sigma factor [Nakamurella sp. PAMC28650]
MGDLLVAVARGDEPAFAELYRMQLGVVTASAMSLLRDFHQAEEVAQEVMLQIWRLAARFDPTRGLGHTWIWQLTRGKAIDRVRHAQSVRRRDQHYAARSREQNFDVVVETALLREDVGELNDTLLKLTTLQREVLVLRFFTELSYTQIAVELDIPLGTVKTRIRDGLIVMRRMLTHRLAETNAA